MLPMTTSDQTPCGALFEILKRYGGISHKELASLILSERPLSDGRSPMSRASDRTWVSRFVVHTPVGSVQARYFRDYGVAARRIMDRLRAQRKGALSCQEVLAMVCGEQGRAMATALDACHQDARLYQNALVRMRDGEGYTVGERAEAAMVLFVAAGCSADVGYAVEYAMNYIRSVLGGQLGTPTSRPVRVACGGELDDVMDERHTLGVVRIAGGCISSDLYWVDPESDGVEIGALVTGPFDIADVDGDVSARHARIWYDDVEGGRWLLQDLESTNGTIVVGGDDGEPTRVAPGDTAQIHPGDELHLGATTAFILIEGSADMV